jgi:hexokinase
VARGGAARVRWNRAVAVVRDLEERCATPAELLQRVVNSLAIEMFAGLASDGGSKVRMLLTCVDALPDGYVTLPRVRIMDGSSLSLSLSLSRVLVFVRRVVPCRT